jgi:hypothetical protein
VGANGYKASDISVYDMADAEQRTLLLVLFFFFLLRQQLV